MRRVRVIVNPHAGQGAGAKIKDRVARALRRVGVAFDLDETSAPGDASAWAAAARRAGYETVLAVGGDGTVNEVINGLVQATEEGEVVRRLAICPLGTGNDLAYMAGCPTHLDIIAQHIAAGPTRRIDLGRVDLHGPSRELVRYFGNNVGLGLEARVTLESYRLRWISGGVRYYAAALQALRSYPSPYVEISWETPEGTWERRAQHTLLISVGNSARTGGGFYLVPDALMDDGLLDLAITRPVSRLRILMLMPKTLRGAHRNDPAIELHRCRRLELHCPETLPIHLDGEVVMHDVQDATIDIMPRRLELVL